MQPCWCTAGWLRADPSLRWPSRVSSVAIAHACRQGAHSSRSSIQRKRQSHRRAYTPFGSLKTPSLVSHATPCAETTIEYEKDVNLDLRVAQGEERTQQGPGVELGGHRGMHLKPQRSRGRKNKPAQEFVTGPSFKRVFAESKSMSESAKRLASIFQAPISMLACLQLARSLSEELSDITDRYSIVDQPQLAQDILESPLLSQVLRQLHHLDITREEFSKWVWVLSAKTPDQQAHRFLQPSEKPMPSWLLQEILRNDIKSVRNLKGILVYVQREVLDKVTEIASMVDIAQNDAVETRIENPRDDLPASLRLIQAHEPRLLGLFNRLIFQVQRLWPAALVKISVMIHDYVNICLTSIPGESSTDTWTKHDTHRRCVSIVNRFMYAFSFPAWIEPYKSMIFNWSAQRNLLKLASSFDPPLQLDQNSYRAVARVLSASQKSEQESKAARLRARTWPPWRVHQDGMDAQRSSEDDLSKVVLALNQAQEAGFTAAIEDQVLKILGGLELDGSPTVHTRKILKPIDDLTQIEDVKNNAETAVKSISRDDSNIVGLNPHVWTARITSTRDVQEAWTVFKTFLDRGGSPNLSLYQAMFEKLHFEAKMSHRRQRYRALPGNGKEVIAPADKLYTQSYRLRLQPPHRSDLYTHMIDQGIRPSGECLIALIKHNSQTILQGLHYLYDAGIDKSVLTFLSTPESSVPANFWERLPLTYFKAFVGLCCHFAHRAVKHRPDQDAPGSVVQKRAAFDHFDTSSDWRIFGVSSSSGPTGHEISNPLRHAMQMLHQIKPSYRPIWYELFSTLARPHIIIFKAAAHEPWNDIRAWNKFCQSLQIFHSIGLELDPRGFDILVQNCQKHILACALIPERGRQYVDDTIDLAKREWAKLSEISEENRQYNLPRILHSISAVPVHKYIRLLWRSENAGEIISVLQWMVEANEELEFVCAQAANGPSMMRRTLVAVRVFLRGTEWEDEAKELIDGVKGWGGWPGDEEEKMYLERWCDKLDWISG